MNMNKARAMNTLKGSDGKEVYVFENCSNDKKADI